MKTSPKDVISNTQRPSWILSAAVLLIAHCGVTAAQPPESQPGAAGDVATETPSTDDVFPRVTDPAELRRLATRFQEAAQSADMNRELDEQERRKLMKSIAQGDALLQAPHEQETDTPHENSLHCMALAESFTREAELREQVMKRRDEIEAAEKAGDVDKARELTEQAERLLKTAESSPANRTWRERTFSRTKEFRNRLRQLERQASNLRQQGKYDEAGNVDREILSHFRTPTSLEAVAVVKSYAEEPITFRYPLQHARAADVLATLRKLGNTLQYWVAEERTNTIFARGPRIEVYRANESIDELDRPAPSASSVGAELLPNVQVAGAEDPVVETGNEVQTTTQAVPTLLGRAIDAAESALSPQEPVERIQIYHVQHVSPEEVIDVLRQLFGKTGQAVGNRIVLAATNAEHAEIKTFLTQFDVADPPGEFAAPVNPARGEQPFPNPPGGPAHLSQPPQASTVDLAQAYAAAEQQVANLKAKFKPSAKPIPVDNPLRAQLRAAVAKAFEARQAMLKAELVEFRERINLVGTRVYHRDRIADQIIDRRVEELLNPSLSWDTPIPSTIPSGPPVGESLPLAPDELQPLPVDPIQAAPALGDPIPAYGPAGPLEGTWNAVSAETGGVLRSEEQLAASPVRLIVRGETFALTVGTRHPQGTFRINASADPCTIDFDNRIPDDPDAGPMLGIYELEGDTLRLCFGEQRPASFQTHAYDKARERSYVFRRLKEGYPSPPAGTSSTTPESAGETNDGAVDLARLQGVWSITKAYGPLGRDIAALNFKGTFRFEQDVVRIVWEAIPPLLSRREKAAAQVVLMPGSPAGQLDIVWTNPDIDWKLRCLYGWDHDTLILTLPYDGKDTSALLPRPDELRPAQQALYLELARAPDNVRRPIRSGVLSCRRCLYW